LKGVLPVIVSWSFTGHRPNKIHGFDWNNPWENPGVYAVRDLLLPVLEEKIQQGATKFLSGGAIGFDQIAFFTVQLLKKYYPHFQNCVAAPYREQPKVWKHPDIQRWYFRMLELADSVVYVDELPQYQRDSRTPVGVHSNYKLQIRNEYMVDSTEGVIAFWDGTTGGTANCVQYAQRLNRPVHRIYF
jgi:uncharacterized phage-like protein YoqJ